jgi:acetyl/propionyl-CoA carboxylase alpha subunit/acetyl-CoA carboxylase carboxyltransferase component
MRNDTTEIKPLRHWLAKNACIGIINRGEAAVRFIRAVKEFNATYHTAFSTAAFYLEAERDAMFVEESDSAIPIASLPAFVPDQGCAYLNQNLMREALQQAHCQAAWLGWGFLAENAQFVNLLEQAGVVVLSPPATVMAKLADKISAKRVAQKAGVPLLTWSQRPLQNLDDAYTLAEQIGYPVMIKAARAGGGRGIRAVKNKAEMERQFSAALQETVRVTNDHTLFMEAMVEYGRHLEVQVVCDRYGHIQTLGVRDCSVQRRQQKMIEETPPVRLAHKTLIELEDAARRLVKAVRYESVGTVEFIYDLRLQKFFFMEVNARLQVEHTITEMLYNLDLVKAQIHIALGHNIREICRRPRGVAIEARLNAEDPERDFTPCPGKVVLYRQPSGPGIRVDSGIAEGSFIPREFDSMVAKIIAFGPTRRETLARLTRALQETRIKIEGGTTNRSFLLELLCTAELRTGKVHTRFLEEMLENRTTIIKREHWHIALVAYAVEQYAIHYLEELANFKQKFSRLSPPREVAKPGVHGVKLTHHGQLYNFRVKSLGSYLFHVEIDGQLIVLKYLWRREGNTLFHRENRYNIQMVARGDMVQCEVNGTPYPLLPEAQGIIRAPSPALVISTAVQPGQQVHKGDLVATLEAMKMEIIVTAPTDGIVRQIEVQKGQQVSAGQPLMELSENREAKTVEVQEARISFAGLAYQASLDDREHLSYAEMLVHEFLAVFLGYDYEEAAGKLLQRLQEFIQLHRELYPLFAQTLVQALEIYTSLEQLFSDQQLQAEGFARPVGFQELLTHFFRRGHDRDKGFPRAFTEKLHSAMQWYSWEGLDEEESYTRSFFRIYKSHANLAEKQELLRATLFALEDVVPLLAGCFPLPRLSAALDGVIEISQTRKATLADAAIHARYSLIDRPVLEKMKEAQRLKVGLLIELIIAPEQQQDARQKLLDDLVNAGHYIVFELVQLGVAQDEAKRRLALELLGRRFCRDRWQISGTMAEKDGHSLYHVKSEAEHKLYETVVCVMPVTVYRQELDWLLAYLSEEIAAAYRQQTELLLLLTGENSEEEEIFARLEQISLPVAWCCVGLFTSQHHCTYRIFTPAPGEHPPSRWLEDVRRRHLNPLLCREFKFNRLDLFELQLLYHGEAVFLFHIVAKSNPRDERFFAFVEVAETKPEQEEQSLSHRLVPFEAAVMEAVQAMRTAQAKRKDRLYWNRIVIHMRSLLQTNIQQIREYAGRLVHSTTGLGLERMVVYTRTTHGSNMQEAEFILENVPGLGVNLRRRQPSLEPLQPMDGYVAKVVQARQRGIFYPYEIIKMITRSGGRHEKFPKGEFAEFDIELDDKGQQQIVAVAKRPYGQNKSNVVFGIVTNFMPVHAYPLRRVLLLSDPIGDMGSLAEGECRRVIAALDLAEELKLPLEWVAISAGARIDMASGTENLDWTARTLKRIITFTQAGGEINLIVPGSNVGAQSYWNAEATMLMHTKGLLIMSDDGAMLLTGKKALDFSGSVSGEDNLAIGGVEKIMGPNGESQLWAKDLASAYLLLLRHYDITYILPGEIFPIRWQSKDPLERNVCEFPYQDTLGQGFTSVGDILSRERNPERKKPFDMRQVMLAVIDQDLGCLERWQMMKDAETAIVWETRIGGYAVGLLGIESRPLTRIGAVPDDGPEVWTGGTLFPQSSKKIARAVNSFSGKIPVVVLANLSGFDGSPESLRNCQLEFGAEIGRAVVNFEGPILFVVIARYHGGAYVVFSQALNPLLRAAALEGTYASVIGGAPAAAVVFPRMILKDTYADARILEAQQRLKDGSVKQKEFDTLLQKVHGEKQAALAQKFDQIHSVERAQKVGSISDIIAPSRLRPYIIQAIEQGMWEHKVRCGGDMRP